MKRLSCIILGACMLILFAGCNSPGGSKKMSQVPGNAFVTRTLPQDARAGDNITVYLKMEVNGSLNAVGLEEQYPPGWMVSNISAKGVRKQNPDRIEWLFWSMGEQITNRTISYTVTVPAWYSGTAEFSGKVITKESYPVQGNTQVKVASQGM